MFRNDVVLLQQGVRQVAFILAVMRTDPACPKRTLTMPNATHSKAIYSAPGRVAAAENAGTRIGPLLLYRSPPHRISWENPADQEYNRAGKALLIASLPDCEATEW